MRRSGKEMQGADRQSFSELDLADLGTLQVAARASVVNRTHRVVRERARQMTSRRNRMRSLIMPLLISASLVVILVTTVWMLISEYESNPSGSVDASEQYLVLALWFLPLSVSVLGMVWWSRTRSRRSGGELIR